MDEVKWKKISNIFLLIALFFACILAVKDVKDKQEQERSEVIVKYNVDTILTVFKSPELDLYKCLKINNVQYPEVVYAQAVLETGYFTSKLCREYNNLFGLYNSKKQEFFKFDNWEESVLAYKNMIQYKYIGGDYYKFLDSIGYAEDPNYINKLKYIINDKRTTAEGNFRYCKMWREE